MATATLSSKGRVTIPVQIRAAIGLQPGDRVDFVEIQSGQFAIMARTQSIKCLKGIARKPQSYVSIEDMNAAIAAERTDIRR